MGLLDRFPRLRVEDDPVSRVLWQINRLYCKCVHRFVWQGEDPLPRQGPGILVSNHQSSVDPFILAASTHRVLSFLIAAEYYAIPGLRWFFRWMHCIPVRREGTDAASLRNALKALKQGRLLCIFPEGGIERGFDRARPGVGYLAWRSKAPVFPACVSGTPRVGSVWRALVTPSRSHVRFGEPLALGGNEEEGRKREFISAWTAEILKAVERLRSP